jgi:hypothetical protein
VIALAGHLADLSAFAVVLLGPVPASLAFAGRGAASEAAERLLAALVAWCALQIAVAIALAAGGSLRLGDLLVAEVCLFALGSLLGRRFGRPKLHDLLPAIEWDPSTLAVVGAIGILAVDLGLRLVTRPLVEHDSIGYHLPAVARWLQTGSLVPLDIRRQSAHYPFRRQIAYYPYSWELLGSLFVLPFGEDLFVATPNLMAWTILGLAIVCIGRRLGASPLHALAGAFCVLALPVTRMTLQTMRVDVPLAAFFVASSALALAGNAAGCLASAGLVAGLKTSGLEFAAVGLAAACLLLRRDIVRMPVRALVVVLPALGVGIFWYVRNFVTLGNPLGLIRVAIGGATLLPGPLESSTMARTTLLAVFDARDPVHRQVIGHALRSQLGFPFVLLLCGSLPLLFSRGPHTRTRLVVTAVFLAACALYAASPFSGSLHIGGTPLAAALDQNLRYALPALGLLGALAAAGSSTVIGGLPVVLAMVLVFAGATSHRTLIASLLFGGFVAGLMLARAGRTSTRLSVLFVGGLLLVVGSYCVRANRGVEREQAYGRELERTIAALPPRTVVAHVLPHHSYPLYGPRFTNIVRFIPARTPDREEWIQTLRKHGASIVALGPLVPGQSHGPEVGWLSDPSGPFIRIAGQDATHETVLYQLRSPVTR